ncbi:MAG: transporter substrate-binding domain-containing protein [Phormidesmis sp.]
MSRFLAQKLNIRLPRAKALIAIALSSMLAFTVFACSNGSITAQDVSDGSANADTPAVATVSGTLNQVLDAGVIKIAVPQDSPPFGSVGTDGEPQGYDVEVAKLVAESLEVELELIPVTSTNRIPYLETGRVDLVISSLGATPERAKAIYFSSIPYAPFFSGVYGSASQSVSSYEDLAGKTVGVTQGALEDLELSDKAPESIEIKRFEDNSVTISALLSNQVELIATGNTIAGEVIKNNPDANIESKFVMKNSPCYIGVRRGDLDMLEWVNVFVRHKRFSGEFDTLSQEWFGQPLEVPGF